MLGLSSDTLALVLILFVFLVLLFIFIKMMTSKNKGRTSGGFVSMMGATYELHTKEQQASIQEISERKANKKMDEEKSGDTNL